MSRTAILRVTLFTFLAESLFPFHMTWKWSTVAATKGRRSTSRLCNYFMAVIWPFSTQISIFRIWVPSSTRLHSFFQNRSFHSFDLYTTAFTGAKTFRYCLSVFFNCSEAMFLSFALQAYSRCCRRGSRGRVKSVAILRRRPTASNVLWEQCTQLQQGTEF